jgi:hypothetical protein
MAAEGTAELVALSLPVASILEGDDEIPFGFDS